MRVSEEMEDLQNENMTEETFWGLMALNDEEPFDYGRDYLKDVVYEQKMVLPYQQLPLFVGPDWFGYGSDYRPIVQVGGILRSGELSGASIKAAVRIEHSDPLKNEKEEEEPVEEKKKGDETKWDKILAECKQISDDFPFKIFDEFWSQKAEDKHAKGELEPDHEKYPGEDVVAEFKKKEIKNMYLNTLSTECANYKVRVYLISAQNLTATGTTIDFKSWLAGMNALSTAEPYSVIKVGDGTNSKETGEIRYVSNREHAQPAELNPKLF